MGAGAKSRRPAAPRKRKKKPKGKAREGPMHLAEPLDFDTAMKGILAVPKTALQPPGNGKGRSR